MPAKKTKNKTVKKKKKVTSTVKKSTTKKTAPKKKTTPKKAASKKVVKKDDITYKIYDQEAEADYKPVKKKEKKTEVTTSFERVTEPTTEFQFVKDTDEPEIRKSEPIITPDKPKKKDSAKKIAKKEDVKSKIEDWFSNITSSFSSKKKITSVKKKTKTKVPKKTKKSKNEDIDLDEVVKPLPENKVLRVLVIIHRNLHILFNTLIIVTFIILMLGLKRVLVIPDSTIKYIALTVGFLCIIAISLNKYISGRIFSIMILAGMIAGIYYLNYTYDFINNFNTKLYEYQNYYVVAIDNGRNKSIYNINNKHVGLVSDNSTNVERVLNTKLDNIKYKEYQVQDDLYKDFYDGQYRAIVVKENQYKYLENNNIKPGTKIKKLYKFKVNSKKEEKK